MSSQINLVWHIWFQQGTVIPDALTSLSDMTFFTLRETAPSHESQWSFVPNALDAPLSGSLKGPVHRIWYKGSIVFGKINYNWFIGVICLRFDIKDTVNFLYLAASFPRRTKKRTPHSPYGRGMLCLLWVHILNNVLDSFCLYCVQYCVISDIRPRYIESIWY